MDFNVRPAEGAEVRLCRMLLGNEGCTHPHYQLFVAEGENGLPVGVGSLRSGAEELGDYWTVHIEVVPTCRSTGVEASLLAYARSHAASCGATTLQTMRWFERDSEEQLLWTSRGFAPQGVRYMHEIDIGPSFARMAPLIEQVREHGWIPADAKIVSLAEADLQQVCDLHLKYLGGSMRQLLPLLDGTAPHPYDRQASVVLLCGGQPIGFTLGWFPEPAVCEISANVLAPAVRLGWANVLLKYEALQRVMARGATRFRFTTMERHTDSRKTLRWVGGGTTRVEVRLQCALERA
ncbi:MAG: hypothetical protein C0485_19540 [Pirellula sp.]|nr:hypothetical protein [Pirellula sp.]